MHDNELEMCVLASMIHEPSIIPNVKNAVSETDFYSQLNRDIFRAIMFLSQSQKDIDIIAIHSQVKKEPAYIAELTNKVSTGSNWTFYSDKVKRLAQVRELNTLIGENKTTDPETVEKTLSAIISGAIKISDNQGCADIKSCRDMMMSVVDKIENAVKFRGKFSGIDCGFSSINDLIDGIQNEYMIIGARASLGKTAIAVNMATHMAKNKIPVGYFSLEMSGEALLMRIMSNAATVQARMLRSGLLSGTDIQKICNKGYDIAEYPLYVMDKTRGDLDKIVSKARYMVRVLGVKVIFVDHASLVKHSNKKLQRHEQFSEISNEFQALQRELNVPIIVLAQLGRDSEGKKPTIADLRESGGFEQDADIIMLMHRERKLPEGARFIETSIDVAKNRNGACGEVKLAFFPEYIRFADMEQDRGKE